MSEIDELRRTLAELLQLCESTSVQHGHGDSGDVLSYYPELRERAHRLVRGDACRR